LGLLGSRHYFLLLVPVFLEMLRVRLVALVQMAEVLVCLIFLLAELSVVLLLVLVLLAAAVLLWYLSERYLAGFAVFLFLLLFSFSIQPQGSTCFRNREFFRYRIHFSLSSLGGRRKLLCFVDRMLIFRFVR
jgi:hypothetical protein